MQCGGMGNQRVEAGKHPRPIGIERVEGAGAGQHFQRPLADQPQIDPPREVEQGAKWRLAARRDQQPHRLAANILERAQRIEDAALRHSNVARPSG
jgi:hypothetical protein